MPFSKRRSLAVKIPLLTSVLLLAALAAMSAASYVELRTALVELATGRLHQAADQISAVFAMSARQRTGAMKELMAHPEIHEFLLTRDASQQPAIDAAVRTYLGPALPYANVELWDATGHRVLAAGSTFEEISGPLLEEFKKEMPPTGAASIGRLRLSGEELQYPVSGAVSHDGKVIGYVVERRRISNPTQTRQTIALLTGLIGTRRRWSLAMRTAARGRTW